MHASERFENILTINCENMPETEKWIDVPILYYRDYHALDVNTGMELEIGESPDGKVRVFLLEY